MMFISWVVLCLGLVTALSAYDGSKPFKGHKVIRVIPKTEHQLLMLAYWFEDKIVDVWWHPSHPYAPVDFRISTRDLGDVNKGLNENGINSSVLIDDVQTLVDDTDHVPSQFIADFDIANYHTLEEIHAWIGNTTHAYSQIASEFTAAISTENRALLGMKINIYPGLDRPAFWIQGGLHAREWIGPATIMYIATQMIAGYDKHDVGIMGILDKYIWYILPVANPDGYVYTWTQDRMWRKTRSINQNRMCIGVDPNRNWNANWDQEGPGASTNPCSNLYQGPFVFSEPETFGVASYIQTINNLQGFIDFHSYSQMWMTPWGYNKRSPRDFYVQNQGSKEATKAIESVHGKLYKHGTIANTIYLVTGDIIDWAYDKVGVTFAYAVELRDTGRYAFLLPAKQIVPTAEETLHALTALTKYTIEH